MLNYAIIGGGRLARHFSEYFHLLEIAHVCWTRDHLSSFNSIEIADADLRLKQTLVGADRVLLLVSDSAIADVLKQYPWLHNFKLIHCSGSLSLPGVAGVHPLMTFTNELYDLDIYRKIPFVVETACDFSELFPALPNSHFVISAQDKARYHAMCVMAGNFPQLMWKAVSDRFEQQLEWPAEILAPYLEQLVANFVREPESALTGPLVRNDRQTLELNVNALVGDPMQDLYRAFLQFFEDSKGQVPLQAQIHMEKTA